MNIIYKLFNEQFVKDLFKKKILPKYPDFIDIKKIKIQPHKKIFGRPLIMLLLNLKLIL